MSILVIYSLKYAILQINCFDFIDHAQEPQLSINGIPRVGEQSRVSCTVRHTCISAPPILALNGRTGADQIMDTLVSDGIWERKVERIWTVEEEEQSVKCTVSYHGGQTATSELRLNVECEYNTRPRVTGIKMFTYKTHYHVSA